MPATHQTTVAQARAHRVFKAHISLLLRPHKLTMMQWSIIGLLANAGPKGLRISDLAQALDTSLAFITTTINVLEAKGVVQRTSHGRDNRAKLVHLTAEFKPLVARIEKEISNAFYDWLGKSISQKDLTVYLQVLEQISSLSTRSTR